MPTNITNSLPFAPLLPSQPGADNGVWVISTETQIRFYVANLAVILLALGLRIWSYRGNGYRLRAVPSMRWFVDGCLLVSLGVFVAITTVQIILLKNKEAEVVIQKAMGDAYGSRTNLDKDEVFAYKSLYASRILYVVFTYVMKGAYMGHYMSLNEITSIRIRSFLHLIIGGTVICGIMSIIITAIYCYPVSLHWTYGEAEYCNPFLDLRVHVLLTYLKVALDMMILTFPIITVLDFHSNNKPRYIIGLVCTGIWPIFFATFRFGLVINYLDKGDEHTSPQNMIALASQLEMAFLLIVVNFPAFRVLRRKLAANPRLKRNMWGPFNRWYIPKRNAVIRALFSDRSSLPVPDDQAVELCPVPARKPQRGNTVIRKSISTPEVSNTGTSHTSTSPLVRKDFEDSPPPSSSESSGRRKVE